MALRRTTLIQGPAGPPGTRVAGPIAWSPGTIPQADFVVTTITLSGASPTNCAIAAWSAVLPDGVFMTAQVTATDTVKVYMMNLSGVSQSITAGDLFVEVFV